MSSSSSWHKYMRVLAIESCPLASDTGRILLRGGVQVSISESRKFCSARKHITGRALRSKSLLGRAPQPLKIEGNVLDMRCIATRALAIHPTSGHSIRAGLVDGCTFAEAGQTVAWGSHSLLEIFLILIIIECPACQGTASFNVKGPTSSWNEHIFLQ